MKTKTWPRRVLGQAWTVAAAVVLFLASDAGASVLPIGSDWQAAWKDHEAQLERWCNATLPAQLARRATLQRLLEQAQLLNGPPLQQQEQEAVSLGDHLEQQRLSAQALQSSWQRSVTEARLQTEDARTDVKALQQAVTTLAGSTSADAVQRLEVRAEQRERQLQAQVQLLQTGALVRDATQETSRVESEYWSKRSNISQLQQQYFTAQRSLDVLMSAIEDESMYLADLQTACGLVERVRSRLEAPADRNGVFAEIASEASDEEDEDKPESTTVTAAVAAAPAAAAAPPAEAVAAPAAPASVQVVQPHAAAIAVVPITAQPTPLPMGKAQRSTPQEAVAAANPSVSEEKSTMHRPASAPAAKASLPKAPAKQDDLAKAAADLNDDDDDSALAPAHQASQASKAPARAAKPAAPVHAEPAASRRSMLHKGKTKAATVKRHAAAATPAPVPSASEDEGEDAKAVPAAKPRAAAKKAAAKAAPTAAPAAAAAVAEPLAKAPAPAAAKVPDEFAKMAADFNDDDDDGSAPAPAARKQRHSAAAAKAPEAAAPAAASRSKRASKAPAEPAGDRQPLLSKGKAKGKKHKAGDDVAAAQSLFTGGGLPSQYTAWTPDSAASAPAAADASAGADAPVKDQPASKPEATSKEAKKGATDAPTKPPARYAVPAAAPAAADAAEVNDDGDLDDAASAPAPATKLRKGRHQSAPVAKDSDDDLDGDGALAKKPKHAPSLAQVKKDDDSSDDLGSDAASDQPPPPKRKAAAKPDAASKATAKQDDSLDTSEADDSEDELALPSTKPRRAASAAKADDNDDDLVLPSMKPSHATSAEKDDSDDDLDDTEPARKPKQADTDNGLGDDADSDDLGPTKRQAEKAPKPQAAAKEDGKKAGGAADMPGNLPSQYAAWTPTADASKAPAKHDTAFAKLAAEFKDDDDDDEGSAPASSSRKGRHRGRSAEAAATTPAPVTKSGEYYDDDDLPKHKRLPITAELSGGWQSFLHKGNKPKPKKPKLDADVAIMQSLYANGGALPSQYSAWTPNADTPPAPAASADASGDGDSSDDAGKSGASKDDGGDSDDAAAVTSTDLVALAAKEMKENGGGVSLAQVGTRVRRRSPSPSIAASSSPAVVTAASTVLESYGRVLGSTSLQQLAKARLSGPKLAELAQQLQNVDGKSAAGAVLRGRQREAYKWCLYFQQNRQLAAPLHQAVEAREAASNVFTEATAQRAALVEETEARTQLRRTVDQDTRSISSILGKVQEGLNTADIHLVLKQGGHRRSKGSMNLGVAVGTLRAAYLEIADVLEAAAAKRQAVSEVQGRKLRELVKATKEAEAKLAQSKAQVSKSQADFEAARKKLAGIQASCDATIWGYEQKQRAAHLEAHAVEEALQVFAS